MKNNVLKISMIILVSITLVSVIAIILLWQLGKAEGSEEPTIDDIIESSVEIPEITTNLANNQFIRLSLTIQTDDRKAAEELSKREFQVQNIVIQELSEMTEKDLQGKAGKQMFEESIRSLVDPLMQTGKIEQVYIVSYIIQ